MTNPFKAVWKACWDVWDWVLDLMYDLRSMTLALRCHGVPVIMVTGMCVSYVVSGVQKA